MGCGATKDAAKPNEAPQKVESTKPAADKPDEPAQSNPAAAAAKPESAPAPAGGGEIDLSQCGQDIQGAIANHPKKSSANVLILTGNELDQVPSSAGQMAALTELNISENRLANLQSVIQVVPNIVNLDCSDNPITSIDGVASLSKLEKLEAYKMQLAAVPDELFTLKNLAELNLFNNSIKKIPVQVNQLTQLEQLNLASNKLNQLVPNSLQGMTKLKRLALFWNRIVRLPSLADLSGLEVLQLQGNILLDFPTMGTHPNLKEINLTKNEISSIPDAVFSAANFPLLETLEINTNKLEKLPETIGTLPALQKLSVSENKLASLPSTLWGMKSLTFLGFQNNNLTEIPPEISQLKDSLMTLYLEGNQLKGLPKSVSDMKELVRFSLKNNPLETTDELTGILGTIENVVKENGTKPDKGGAKFIV